MKSRFHSTRVPRAAWYRDVRDLPDWQDILLREMLRKKI